jgi:hypothetical protein
MKKPAVAFRIFVDVPEKSQKKWYESRKWGCMLYLKNYISFGCALIFVKSEFYDAGR